MGRTHSTQNANLHSGEKVLRSHRNPTLLTLSRLRALDKERVGYYDEYRDHHISQGLAEPHRLAASYADEVLPEDEVDEGTQGDPSHDEARGGKKRSRSATDGDEEGAASRSRAVATVVSDDESDGEREEDIKEKVLKDKGKGLRGNGDKGKVSRGNDDKDKLSKANKMRDQVTAARNSKLGGLEERSQARKRRLLKSDSPGDARRARFPILPLKKSFRMDSTQEEEVATETKVDAVTRSRLDIPELNDWTSPAVRSFSTSEAEAATQKDDPGDEQAACGIYDALPINALPSAIDQDAPSIFTEEENEHEPDSSAASSRDMSVPAVSQESFTCTDEEEEGGMFRMEALQDQYPTARMDDRRGVEVGSATPVQPLHREAWPQDDYHISPIRGQNAFEPLSPRAESRVSAFEGTNVGDMDISSEGATSCYSTISRQYDLGPGDSRADPDFHIILSAVVEPKDEREDRRVNRRVNGRQARDSSSRFMCPDYTYKPMMSKDCRFPALPNVPHLATCLAKRFRLSQSAWNARIDIVLSIEDGNQVRWPNATDEFIALNVIAGVPSDVCPAPDGPGGLSSGSLVEMINGELRGKTGILKGIKNDRVVVLVIDNGVEVHKFVSASDVRLMPETDLIQLLLQGSRRSTVESGVNEQNLCADFLAEIDHILSGNNDRTEKDEVEILLESRTASPRRCARTSSRSPDDTLRQRTRSPVPKADVPLMTTPIKKKTANHSEANSLPPKRGNFVGKGDISEERWGPIARLGIRYLRTVLYDLNLPITGSKFEVLERLRGTTAFEELNKGIFPGHLGAVGDEKSVARWGPIATFGTKYLRAVLFDMNLPTSGSKLELLHRLSKTTAFRELNKCVVPELPDHLEKRGRGNTLGDCSHEKYGKLAWMTNKELRQVLRQSMLSAQGNKLQLLDRLQAAMNRRAVVKNSAGKPAAAMEENYAKVKEENSDKGLTILSAVADGMTACV